LMSWGSKLPFPDPADHGPPPITAYLERAARLTGQREAHRLGTAALARFPYPARRAHAQPCPLRPYCAPRCHRSENSRARARPGTQPLPGARRGAEKGDVLALRDRALFAVMLYGFLRVGPAVKMTARNAKLPWHKGASNSLDEGGTYSISGSMLTTVHGGTTDVSPYCVQGASMTQMPLPASAPRGTSFLPSNKLRAIRGGMVNRRCGAAGTFA
jgi:hypothetical protein